MKKAVFLDRDGILIRTNIVDGKPFAIRSIKEFEILENVPSQLNRLKKHGFLLIVVSNQPDVKRGITSLNTLNFINKKLLSLLPLDCIKCCVETEEECTGNYKPKPGMLLTASKEFNIDLEKSYIIGDRWRDIGAGYNAGCKSILINYNYNEKLIYYPNFITTSFVEAVDFIIND